MNIKTTSLHRSFVIHLTKETNINCNGKIAEVIFLTLLGHISETFYLCQRNPSRAACLDMEIALLTE